MDKNKHPDEEFPPHVSDHIYTDRDGREAGVDFHHKLNIFIGPNNSKKSRLMRRILTTTFKSNVSPHFHSPAKDLQTAKGISPPALTALRNIENITQSDHLTQEVGLVRSAIKELIELYPTGLRYRQALEELSKKIDNLEITVQETHNYSITQSFRTIRLFKDKLALDETDPYDAIDAVVYIPTTRSLRMYQFGNPDVFKLKTIAEYFGSFSNSAPHRNKFKVFTGQEFYSDLKKRLLGKKNERDQVYSYQNYLSEQFFDNKSVTLIPNETEKSVTVSVDGGTDHKIYDMGEGMQTLIIITYCVHVYGKGVYFIEEPDAYLHPGLQRRLVERLASYERHQFFITTHSNHVVDMANNSDGYVFTLNPVPQDPDLDREPERFDIRHVEPQQLDLARLLGVRLSASTIVNATIWVEGVGDRILLKHYLDLYQTHLVNNNEIKEHQRFREDVHFGFFQFGGDNIIQYEFKRIGELSAEDWEREIKEDEARNGPDRIYVHALAKNVFLLLDKDDTEADPDSKKAERNRNLKQSLKERAFVLPVREIENTISPQALFQTIFELKPTKQEYDKEQKRKFLECSPEAYKDTFIWEHIHEHFGESLGVFGSWDPRTSSDKKTRKAKGTLTEKKAFNTEAVKHMRDWDSLTPCAQNLAKKVHKFLENTHSAARTTESL